MKDWRGVPINVGDQVVWASRGWSGDREPRVGRVTGVNPAKNVVTIKRAEPAPGKYESGSSNLPSHRVTRVDYLPTPEAECGGLDAI